MSTAEQRLRMAAAIVNFEARRDSRGRLAVYALPSGDGGGSYEVAGINDRYHKVQVDKLVALIRAGKHKEAEASVVEYLVKYTDVAKAWHSNPGVEFFLRDSVFNRGPTGAAQILQKAVGVIRDGKVGPLTMAAIAKYQPLALLGELRLARQWHERNVVGRGPGNKFWNGLVNRWDKALKTAKAFAAE